MKVERSTAAKSIHAVALVITLVTVVTFATIGYSIYEEVSSVLSSVSGGHRGALGTIQRSVVGGNVQLQVNFTVPNTGLYTLGVQVRCSPPPGLSVTCSNASVVVPPGQTSVLSLLVTADGAQIQGAATAGRPINLTADASISLEPFATLTVGINLGQALEGASA